MADDFYSQLKARIAMHAERDFTRMVDAMKEAPTRKKPLSNTQRHYKWLEGFKQRYGMTYAEYLRRVKLGLMERLSKTDNHYTVRTTNLTEAPKDCSEPSPMQDKIAEY